MADPHAQPTRSDRRTRRLWQTVAGLPLAVLVVIVTAAGTLAAAPGVRAAVADPPGAAASDAPGALGPTVTFHGRGYGHGVGMSQYGALGRAEAGHTAEQILAHYYQGATLEPLAASTPIRVRLLAAFPASTSTPLVIHGRRAAWRIDGVPTRFPRDARLEVRPVVSGDTVSWRVRVIAPGGVLLRDAVIRSFRVRGMTSAAVFEVDARSSTYDTYRGVLRIGLLTTAPTASVTNELPLEWYLRGVVPAEMPSGWPAEALQAQAIAARSYAARRLRPGVSYFDVPDDSSSQVYRGLLGERATTDAAIAATAGIVLMGGSSVANAMFHSAGGGATEHNENVYVSSTGAKVASPVSYLRGSADRRADGTAFDDASPYATWTTSSYSIAALSAIFAKDPRTAVGTLEDLDLDDRGVSGRLISVRLIGSAGTRTVSGDVFRSVFNTHRPTGDPSMRSTLVDLAPVP